MAPPVTPYETPGVARGKVNLLEGDVAGREGVFPAHGLMVDLPISVPGDMTVVSNFAESFHRFTRAEA